MRKWAQELLDQHQAAAILPFLDAEGIRCLTPAQRLGLTRRLALSGLPEAGQAIMALAPPAERPALVKAALEGTSSTANPRAALDLLPGKAETPQESLMRAQAELALHDWAAARAALARASAGPERIQALLTYLNRPPGTGETAAARIREVDGLAGPGPGKGPRPGATGHSRRRPTGARRRLARRPGPLPPGPPARRTGAGWCSCAPPARPAWARPDRPGRP